MKIARVSMIGNELALADAIRKHSLKFFDHAYFAFQNSQDGTMSRISSHRNFEMTTVSAVGYPQSTVVSNLINQAFKDGADAVIPLDADEFLSNQDSIELKNYLTKFESKVDFILIPWRNLAPKQYPINKNFQDLYFAHNFSEVHKVIILKSAYEKGFEIEVSQGSHHLVNSNLYTGSKSNDVFIYHLPFRSQLHYSRKMLQGAAAMYRESNHDLSDDWINGAANAFISESELKNLAFDYGSTSCNVNHESIKVAELSIDAEYSEILELKSFLETMPLYWRDVLRMFEKVPSTDYSALELKMIERRLRKIEFSPLRYLLRKLRAKR